MKNQLILAIVLLTIGLTILGAEPNLLTKVKAAPKETINKNDWASIQEKARQERIDFLKKINENRTIPAPATRSFESSSRREPNPSLENTFSGMRQPLR